MPVGMHSKGNEIEIANNIAQKNPKRAEKIEAKESERWQNGQSHIKNKVKALICNFSEMRIRDGKRTHVK